MSESGGYHDDTFEAERGWRQEMGDTLVAVSTVLVVVGSAAAVGWLWLAARSQGLLGDEWPSGFGASDRVDYFVGTLDQLVIAVLGITIGVALRRQAERESA